MASQRIELIADRGRPQAWTMLVDGAPQSHVDLADPRRLEFGYMRRLGYLADLAAPPGQPLRVLHLGGGALTLARYVQATRPGSAQLAVEADPDIAELVARRLPLGQRGRRRGPARAGRVRIRVADARAVAESLRPGSFDLVVADLFAGGRTPAHVTSAEFDRAVARVLGPSGRYAVNVADGPPFSHARARVAAVRAAFAQVCVIADASGRRGRGFGNLVIVGSARSLPVTELVRLTAADAPPGLVLDGPAAGRFAAGARPITDARPQPSPLPPAGVFAPRR